MAQLRRTLAVLGVVWLPAAIAGAAQVDEPTLVADRETLIAGVEQIAAPGSPGPLVVTSDEATVIADVRLIDGSRAPVIVAGYDGDGRFVAFGHTDYVRSGVLSQFDTGRLIAKAALWASGDARLRGAPRVGATDPEMVGFFDDLDMDAVHLTGRNWSDDLETLDVVVCGQRDLSPTAVADVRRFLENGGGLLIGGLGWGWMQRNPGREIDEHPCSLILGPAGVFWARGASVRTDVIDIKEELEPELHAGEALEALNAPSDPEDLALWRRLHLRQRDEGERDEMIGRTLLRAMQTIPEGDETLWPRIAALIAMHRGHVIPTAARPIEPVTLEGLTLAVELREARRASPDEMMEHPAARVFPGDVPDDAPRETRELVIDTARPGWHSTGLYAPPGEIVTLTVPEAAVGARLRLRIGCHQDDLDRKPHWVRVPAITRDFPVHDTRLERAWAFGGPIYIDVRRTATSARSTSPSRAPSPCRATCTGSPAPRSGGWSGATTRRRGPSSRPTR